MEQKPLDEQASNQNSAPSLVGQQQQQDGASSQNQGSANEIRYLWIGDLQPWMDEVYLKKIFSDTSEVLSAKVVRKSCYGFVEFVNHSVAETVLKKYSGAVIPGCDDEQTFKLSWFQPSYRISVDNLASKVTDSMLMETFKKAYKSVLEAYVETGRKKKKYGFVSFGDKNEQMDAIRVMNDKYCLTRPMHIESSKKLLTKQPAMYQNTEICVGGVNDSVTEEDLKSLFGKFGDIVHVYILPRNHSGFVRFANRKCAEDAFLKLKGAQLGGETIRLSWSRCKQYDQ